MIRSGEVEVERNGVVVDRMGSGAAFGEIALLLEVPRTATVRAITSTRLLALSASDSRDALVGYGGRADDLELLSRHRLANH